MTGSACWLIMDAAAAPAVSPLLLEANRRLQELRELHKKTVAAPVTKSGDRDEPLTQTGGRQRWHSENLAAHLRAVEERRQQAAARADALSGQWVAASCPRPPLPTPPLPHSPTPPSAHSLSIYPDLALALLKEDQAAPGRLWLLLHLLDAKGQGMVSIEQVRETVTDIQSPLYLCGWRQLRNLLRQGEGLFWQRDEHEQRLWLRSTAKVAAALAVPRFQQRPVQLPAHLLCGSLGEARAHLFATFHSSRAAAAGEGNSAPISRQTLERLSGVPARTQQEYERRAGVKSQANYAIGEPYQETAARQERAWQKGHAVFEFIDHKGRQGGRQSEKKNRFVAWQLPNSYTAAPAHEAPQRGRYGLRRLNQSLADLRTQGGAGNDQPVAQPDLSDRDRSAYRRRYYDNGGAAATAYNRDPIPERYWRGRRGRTGSCLWYVLPGEGGS